MTPLEGTIKKIHTHVLCFIMIVFKIASILDFSPIFNTPDYGFILNFHFTILKKCVVPSNHNGVFNSINAYESYTEYDRI